MLDKNITFCVIWLRVVRPKCTHVLAKYAAFNLLKPSGNFTYHQV
jgi:hypothetical protein